MRPPQLIAGPYRTPPVRRGYVLTCLVRDAECIVTSFTDSPLVWPRGRPRDSNVAGVIITEELAQAVRTESAKAMCYLLGVSDTTISKWRHALGVFRTTPGSSKLWRDSFDRIMTPAVRRKRRRAAYTPEVNAKKRGPRPPRPLWWHAATQIGKDCWTDDEDRAVLELAPAVAVSALGRTLSAVYTRRCVLLKRNTQLSTNGKRKHPKVSES